MNTTLMQEEERPWKTDLARKSAQRRELVLHDVEEAIRKASSFEEALRQSLEILKKRFARYSAITAYVADGEDLVVQTSLDRPTGPDRVGTSGGPLADAGHGHATTVVSDVSVNPGWAAVGLTSGSAMISPVRTEAGLWAIVEVWSDFRDAFTAHDSKMLAKVTLALAKKTPTA